MAQSFIKNNFSMGELSYKLRGRTDSDQYKAGSALMRNFFVDYQGGVTTRAGSQQICPARQAATGIVRVTRFQIAVGQSFVLEWSDQVVRFFSNRLPVIDFISNITAITQANPGVMTVNLGTVTTIRANDMFQVVGIVGMTQLNGRIMLVKNPTTGDGGFTWSFQLFDPVANALIDTTTFSAYISGGKFYHFYYIFTPYLETEIFALKFTQSADVMSITHPNHAPTDLTYNGTAFALTPSVIGPQIATPTNLVAVPTDIGTHRYGYTVTAVSLNGKEESLPCFYQYVDSELLGLDGGGSGATHSIALNWTGVSTAGSYRIYKWGDISTDGITPDNTVFGFAATSFTTNWTDNNVAPDYTQTPPTFRNPFAPGRILSAIVSAPGTGYGTGGGPGADKSRVLATITGDGTGATGYGLCQESTGQMVGFVLQLPGTGFTHATATFTGTGGTGATVAFTFAPLTGTYPAVCGYFQQRRVYGSSTNEPETIDFSQTGNYGNFDQAIIPLANDAIEITIDAGANGSTIQVNTIESFSSTSVGMMTLTSGGAFMINGGQIGEPVTPSQIVAKLQASPGAGPLQPIVVNTSILFVTLEGTVREFLFNYYVQSYYGIDRSVTSQHLFTNHSILDWTWAEKPNRIIWAVRDDGVLLSFTYVPEQETYGWAHHDTNGLYKSITSVNNGLVDDVYMIVQRQIGANSVPFIELMSDRRSVLLQNPSTSYFYFYTWAVDCGLRATFGVPTTRVTGLWHLVGMTVTGLGDGLVIPPTVVAADGSVTLPWPAFDITLGLAFQSQWFSLELDIGAQQNVQGKRKLQTGVTVKTFETTGLKIGPNSNTFLKENKLNFPVPLTEIKQPLFYAYTPPNERYTEDIHVNMMNYWSVYGQVFIQQDYPLSATILAISPEVTFGDTQR